MGVRVDSLLCIFFNLRIGDDEFMCKLPKQGILRKNKNFQVVYKTGRSYANKMLVMYVLPSGSPGVRVGFAAGKRLGNAVVRNRVKRLLREAYRLNRAKLMEDMELVLVGRKPIVGVDFSVVAGAFLDLCARARILAKIGKDI